METHGNKQIAYFSITFILGIVLILLGSVIQVPYITYQTIREDRSKDWTKYMRTPSDFDYPLYENASLRKIALPPLSAKKYLWESMVSLRGNMSVVQIDVGTSGPLTFKIVEMDYENYTVGSVFFHQAMHFWGFVDDISEDDWRTYFWTPHYEWVFMVGLVFENPSDREIVFSFKVTEYFLKATEERRVTQYRTPLDSYFGYVGISLIATAVTLNIYYSRQGKQLKPSLGGKPKAWRDLMESAVLIVSMFMFCVIYTFLGYLVVSNLFPTYPQDAHTLAWLGARAVFFGCLIGYGIGIVTGLIIKIEEQIPPKTSLPIENA